MAQQHLKVAIEALTEQTADLQRTQQAIREDRAKPAGAYLVSRNLDIADTQIMGIHTLAEGMKASMQNGADDRIQQLAGRVFGTTELLEAILRKGLSVHDLLRAMEVNKTFAACVKSSVHLQKLLCLRPDPTASYRSAFEVGIKCLVGFTTSLTFPALSPATYRKARTSLDGTLEAHFDTDLTASPPRIGPRCRSMLVCQPPVHEMAISINCCGFRYEDNVVPQNENGTAYIKAIGTAGLTIGELLDTTRRLQEAHTLCPFAATTAHSDDEDGRVRVEVRFTGTLSIRKNGAIIQAYLRQLGQGRNSSWARLVTSQAEAAARRLAVPRPIVDYVKAKLRGISEPEDLHSRMR